MAAAGGVCAALVRWGGGTSWGDLLEPALAPAAVTQALDAQDSPGVRLRVWPPPGEPNLSSCTKEGLLPPKRCWVTCTEALPGPGLG